MHNKINITEYSMNPYIKRLIMANAKVAIWFMVI